MNTTIRLFSSLLLSISFRRGDARRCELVAEEERKKTGNEKPAIAFRVSRFSVFFWEDKTLDTLFTHPQINGLYCTCCLTMQLQYLLCHSCLSWVRFVSYYTARQLLFRSREPEPDLNSTQNLSCRAREVS
jgi:hypothetical protein